MFKIITNFIARFLAWLGKNKPPSSQQKYNLLCLARRIGGDESLTRDELRELRQLELDLALFSTFEIIQRNLLPETFDEF